MAEVTLSAADILAEIHTEPLQSVSALLYPWLRLTLLICSS